MKQLIVGIVLGALLVGTSLGVGWHLGSLSSAARPAVWRINGGGE